MNPYDALIVESIYHRLPPRWRAHFPHTDVFSMRPATVNLLIKMCELWNPRRILELGPGISTYALLAWGSTKTGPPVAITALEAERNWFDLNFGHWSEATDHDRAAASQGRVSLEVLRRPLKDGWYDFDAKAHTGGWDLVVVDGPRATDHPEARKPAFERLRGMSSSRSVWFVDDYQRASEQLMVREWLKRDSSLGLWEFAWLAAPRTPHAVAVLYPKGQWGEWETPRI